MWWRRSWFSLKGKAGIPGQTEGRPATPIALRAPPAGSLQQRGPRALAGRLRRAATFLRSIGIEIGFKREGRARTRVIHITTAPSLLAPERGGERPSAPSASSAPLPKSNSGNGFVVPDLRTPAHDADGAGRSDLLTVRANPLMSKVETAADGADANYRPQSAFEKFWTVRL